MIVAIGAVVVLWAVLRYTTFGRSIYAVGGNREAAELSGVRAGWVIAAVYGIVALSAAVAGIMMIGRQTLADPNAGNGIELTVASGILLGGVALYGGVGSVWGAALGTVFLAVLANTLALRGLGANWQLVVTGAILLVAVYLDRVRQRIGSGLMAGGPNPTTAEGRPMDLTQLTTDQPELLGWTMPGLDRRTAIITGAASGIGAAAARGLVAAGARVVLVDRDAEGLSAVAAGLDGDRAVSVVADLADRAAHQRIVAAALDAFGGLTTVLHIAGVIVPNAIGDVTHDELDLQMRVNLGAPFWLSPGRRPASGGRWS